MLIEFLNSGHAWNLFVFIYYLVQDRIPLRDRGIDFPRTIYKILREIFEEGYEYITSRYSTRK